MRNSGTRKKSPSQKMTGASRPASPRVQPPSFFSPMLRALYLGEDALVLAGLFSHVLDELQPLEDLGWRGVGRDVLERFVDHRQRGLVGRGVIGVVGELGSDLGIEDVVYELVGVIRMRCTCRYRHVVYPAGRRRLWNDVVEVVVLSDGPEAVPRVDVGE